METDLTKGVDHRHHRHLTDQTLTLAAAHIISATKGEKMSALQYWPSTLNLADRLCMSSSAHLRTSWRETECTRWRLRVLTDILQAAFDVRPDACPLRCEAWPPRRQCEEAARQQGLLRRCSRRWKRNRPAVWERRVLGKVRWERDRRGWAVRGFMARATKRRGVSRSFPRRAGEASRCAPQRLAPWKRSIRRYPQGLCGGCFDARAGRENEGAQVNGLLAPQGLVWLFAGYQTRPICFSCFIVELSAIPLAILDIITCRTQFSVFSVS
jgi:hypothetical protein